MTSRSTSSRPPAWPYPPGSAESATSYVRRPAPSPRTTSRPLTPVVSGAGSTSPASRPSSGPLPRPERLLGGGVGVHHVAVRVQDHEQVAHPLDEQAARQRPQPQQPLVDQPPGEHRAGAGEGHGRQVDLREGTHLEVEQQVGHPRQQRRDGERRGLQPVRARQPHQRDHEQRRRGQQQRLRVDQVHPEQRPALHGRRRVVGRVADQVMGARQDEQHEHGQRLDRQRQQQPPGHERAAPGVQQDERHPGGGERADAEVLRVAPAQPRGRVVGDQLAGVGGVPGREGEQQDHQAVPARPDRRDAT